MPTPSTAVEIEMMTREYRRHSQRFHEEFFRRSFTVPLVRQLDWLVIRRRPFTDDMMQMIVDLGIDPPERHHDFDFETVTFDWSSIRTTLK